MSDAPRLTRQADDPPPRVFISYSHDDEAHLARVLEVANHLRDQGVDAELDQFLVQPEEGWSTWAERQMAEAEAVLLIFTPRYRQAWDKEPTATRDPNSAWQAHLARQHLVSAGARSRRFIPTYLGPGGSVNVPPALADWTAYELATEAGRSSLVRRLVHEAAPRRPLGPRPARWRRTPGTFGGLLYTGIRDLPRAAPPSQLLVPRHAVVPFTGRETELADLDAWAAAPAPFAVRLVVGDGGMGKTRLAQEWAARRRAAAWHAGFLANDLESAADRLLDADRPTAVIIDYAESRPELGAFLQRLSAPDLAPANPLRVLLLARNADDWFAALRSSNAEINDHLWESPVLHLRPLVLEDGNARHEEWERAREAFERHLAILGQSSGAASQAQVPDLTDQRYRRALYLHAAALVSLLGGEPSPVEVLETILRHEEDFWWQSAGPNQPAGVKGPTPRERERWLREMRRLVAAIALRGGLAHVDDLRPLASALRIEALSSSPGVFDSLSSLYPAHTDGHRGSTGLIAALEPDLLAETLVASVLSSPSQPRDTLEAALGQSQAPAVRHALVLLGRLELRSLGDAGSWLDRALACCQPQDLEAAFEAALALTEDTHASSLGQRLAHRLSVAGTPAIARVLAGRLPSSTVSLREVGAWAARVRLEELSTDAPPELLAKRLSQFAFWHGGLGQRESALRATEEAVQIYRKLVAASRPDAFLPHLARSLNNLGASLSELGRREDALEAAQEAVALYRNLAASRPDAFLPELAMSLHNLGASLSELGRREDALEAAREAVALYRNLAASRPDAFVPALAGSLNSLGERLGALGWPKDALEAAREAVHLYRSLAASRPDACLPDLAMSLNNLGNRLSEVGRPDDALEATREAVDLDRSLAATRPDAFVPALAGSLNNLGYILSELGRREDALEAAREAVDLHRSLAASRPDAFVPDLARSVSVRGDIYAALGSQDPARHDAREALELFWPLFEAEPESRAKLTAVLVNDCLQRFGAPPPDWLSPLARRVSEASNPNQPTREPTPCPASS